MIAGVLLAAGASRRMGRDKALVRKGSDSFLVSGVRRLWAACDRVVVVLGAHHAAIRRSVEEEFGRLVSQGALDRDLRPRLGRASGPRGIEVHFIVNPSWRQGMLSSARAGLRDALGGRPESVVVLPVDHPDVHPTTIYYLSMLMRAARESAGRRERAGLMHAIVPRYRRRRGHPVALSVALAQSIVADGGAADLSDAIRRNAKVVSYADIADPGVVRNRNQPGD